MALAVRQGLLGRHRVPVGARHVPALPLRPDHAPGLEGLHPDHAGVAGRGGPVDADAVEYLEVDMKPPRSLSWLRPALRAFTSLRDMSLRRNRRLSLPPEGASASFGVARQES